MTIILNWLYKFSTQTTEPPIQDQLRFNANVYADVTKLWIPTDTSDGVDVYRALVLIPTDAIVYIQDQNDHTQSTTYHTTGAPVDKVDYIELPVSFQQSSAPLANNQGVLVLITSLPAGPPPGTPLVTLAEAKAHLEIVGTDADADVELKLAAAQAAILDYCSTTAYWRPIVAGWTAATVPFFVKAAILLLLGELDKFRGDEAADDAATYLVDRDFSPAIQALLRRTRDPVLA